MRHLSMRFLANRNGETTLISLSGRRYPLRNPTRLVPRADHARAIQAFNRVKQDKSKVSDDRFLQKEKRDLARSPGGKEISTRSRGMWCIEW